MSVERRKLYRSRNDRMLFGVCAGIADYFDVDVTLIRLAFVVASLLGGPGILAYIICLILVPIEPENATVIIDQEAS